MPTGGVSKFQETNKLSVGQGCLSQNGRVGEQLSTKAQVVIVGAGLAGLAAAQRLHEQGVKDVLILDAQDRVGGRVHTIKHGDYLLELGAQWLHGANDNPLHQWLTSLKMLDDFEDASTGFRGTFCSIGSSERIDPKLVEKVLAVVNESKTNLFNDSQSCGAGPTKGGSNNRHSASQVFRRHLEASIERGDPQLVDNKQLVYAIFDWFLRYETIENCCDHMDEVSIQSYTDWTDLGDGTLLNFRDGYQSLLAWFLEHFPRKQWLHLNKQVLNVELLNKIQAADQWLDTRGHTHGYPVLVRYKDLSSKTKLSRDANLEGGDDDDDDDDDDDENENEDGYENNNDAKIRTIECQHVIVTVSLGFLKHNSRTFFTPPLSSVKQTLIDSIGFGTVNKIVLQFERPFWATSGGGIKLVWRDEDLAGGENDFPKWARDILAFDVVRRQPNLLIGWIGGQGAKTMELESDEHVAEVCVRILERFLPKSHPKPTRLVACLCSRWHSNPFTRGSYSFKSMNSLDLNVDKLHEPFYDAPRGQPAGSAPTSKGSHLRPRFYSDGNSSKGMPRIMFAGEATAGKLYSTTHGAVISGWREADRLVDHLATHNKGSTKAVLSTSREITLTT